MDFSKKGSFSGGIQFSQGIKEGIDVIGENLLDYDKRSVNSDKTLREIADEGREKYIKDFNKLREEAPYKRTFDDTSKISNDILNTADIALAAHNVVKLGEVGVNYVKSVAPEIKSIFSENGLSKLENISGNTKTVTFNSMEFAGDLSETSYVKSSEISEVVSNPNVVTKTNKMGNVITDYTNTSGNKIRFTEQTPKTIPNSIESKLTNPKTKGDPIEAKVAKYINEETSSKVTAFGQKVENTTTKKRAGDIDVATDKYIIEVKKSTSDFEMEQFNKYTDINDVNYFNYNGKKLIYYFEEPINMNKDKVAQIINTIKETGIPVVNNLEELGGVVE